MPLTWNYVAAEDNAVWAVGGTLRADVHLWRIDPATNAVVGDLLLSKTSTVEGLTVGERAVWISLFDADTVLRVAPS